MHSTFRSYLKCGRLRHGFARIYCRGCKHTRLVAFSCKRRGVCPSCTGRRMAQAALHQSREMVPHVPVRQWVLTFPAPLHIFLAYRPEVMTETLALFVECLRYTYRQRCLPQLPASTQRPRRYDPDSLRTYSTSHPNDIGAITSIQRSTDALSLFPHFHTLVTDGVFFSKDQSPSSSRSQWNFTPAPEVKEAAFIEAPPLTEEVISEVLVHFKYRLIKRFVRRGHLRPIEGADAENLGFTLHWGHDEMDEEERQLLKCYAASTTLKHAFGAQSGDPLSIDYTTRLPIKIKGPLCVELDGFGLHAATYVEAQDRDRLAQLCRYIQRPPIAQDRLVSMSDGRFYYAFKRTWANGARGIFFEGGDLMERLAALIPAPRKNITRYHGVFAPRSKLQKCVTQAAQRQSRGYAFAVRKRRRTYWYLWAELMRHTFITDVLVCPQCQTGMQMIALISQPSVIDRLMIYDQEARGPPSP